MKKKKSADEAIAFLLKEKMYCTRSGMVFYKGLDKKEVRQHVKKRGYFAICCSIDGLPYHLLVHRMVYIQFNGVPSKSLEINHKDGNKKNNRLDNLEAITHSENMRHAHRNGLMECLYGERGPNAKLTNEMVLEARAERRKHNTKYKVLADRYGVSESCVWMAINGKQWRHLKRP